MSAREAHILDRAVVFACDFKPRLVNGVSVMPNHGRAAGAPPWLTLGNGTTSTTFPTPLAGFGASFDGGDYVNTGVVDRYEHTDQFSLYFFGTAKVGTTQQIISSMFGTANFRGIAMEQLTSIRMYMWIVSQFFAGDYNLHLATINNPLSSSKSYAMVYDGRPNTSGASSHFENAEPKTVTKLANAISGTIKSGSPFLLGARPDTVAAPGSFLIGRAYAFGIFDGLLTAQDISLLDTRVRGGIR
ncbi:MAG: hypothetical protein EOM24_27060 [Chloroflexia bacterium]|nr:hypothetical protein [Chloroflexia bacterium]